MTEQASLLDSYIDDHHPDDIACTCNCMDCIEGLHCGNGVPNPDGSPTVCFYPPPDDDSEDDGSLDDLDNEWDE
jgi:hypothetical protein